MTATLTRPITLHRPLTARERQIIEDITRREFIIGGTTLAALIAAGCGDNNSSSRSSTTGAGFPRTVNHAGGELTLSERPERVIVAGPYSELDVMLALGVMPVAYGDTGDPLRPWQLAAGAADIDTFEATGGPNAESVAATNADLVIINGTTYANYPEWLEIFGKVCPVLGMPVGIEEQLSLVADALGLDPTIADDATSAVQAALDGFEPAWQPASIAVVNYWGEMYAWTDKSRTSALFERLGLPTLAAPIGPDSSAQGEFLSLERLDLIDADLLLVVADDASFAQLEALPVFSNLAVVRAGRSARLIGDEVFAVGDVTALSLPDALTAIERVLTETKPR